jgi:predicted HicB family RNase H-like nuclease
MPIKSDNVERKTFACAIRPDLHERLRCEAIRSKKTIQALVEEVFDKTIPRDIRVVIGRPRRSAHVEE